MQPINYADPDAYIEDILRPQDIHEAMMTHHDSAATGMFLVLGIIFSVVHAFNLYLAIGTSISFMVPVIIHIIVVAVGMVIAMSQYRRGMDIPFLTLMVITSSTTGIFGTVGTLLAFFAYQFLSQRSMSFTDWFESIFPTHQQTQPEKIYHGIMIGTDENPHAYDVMPFVDVMRLGSDHQKRRAISKMTMQFHPRLAPAFRLAVKDESNAIRVQAATAIAKIENEFMHKLERIETARELAPNNRHVLFALARFYDDYAYTGLLDPEREVINRQKAIDTYKAYIHHDPSGVEAWGAVGRLLFRSQQWEEAANWLKEAMERGMGSRSIKLWYIESLYRLKRYSELRRFATDFQRTAGEQQDLPPEIREAVGLWARQA